MTVYGNNFLRTFGSLSYNVSSLESSQDVDFNLKYTFPPTYTLSCNSKPIMSDNGVSVKYNRHELTITWIVQYDYLYGRNNPQIGAFGEPSPNSIDTAIQQIRAILLRPRGELLCTYQGLGPSGYAEGIKGNFDYMGFSFDKNSDVNFGPIPLDLKWRNLASQRCVELTWVVAVHSYNQTIFDSTNLVVKNPTQFTELVWSRSYDIDEIGAVTITTTGKYSLASNAVNRAGLEIISDEVRFVTAFPVPLYCQRVSQKFQHDPNSKSTTFTIIDKQFPTENALPPKCIKMDLTHEVSSSLFGSRLKGKGFHQWNNVIQGSITIPPGEPFVTAYSLFWFYARQRLFRTEKNGVAYDETRTLQEKLDKLQLTPKEKKEYVRNIVTEVSYKESLFDRTHYFRLEYTGVYDRDYLLQQSGLFTPLYNYKYDSGGTFKNWYDLDTDPKSDIEPWNKSFPRPTTASPHLSNESLAFQWADYNNQFGYSHPNYSKNNSAWNVYGYVGFNESDTGPWVFYPDDQTNNNVKISYAGQGVNLPAWVYPSDPIPNESQAKSQPDYSDLSPEKSYVMYDNNFSIIEDVNTFQIARQSYDGNIDASMKSYQNSNPYYPDKSTRHVALHNAGDRSATQSPPDSDYVSSYNSQPITTILMTGYAIRAGFPPSIPSAFQYKGSSMVRSGQSTVTVKQIAKGAIPVYLATWSIPYYVNTSVHSNFFRDLESVAFAGDLT